MRMKCSADLIAKPCRVARLQSLSRTSRIFPFPDGIDRILTMSKYQWNLFDKYFSKTDPFYWYALERIIEVAPSWAKHDDVRVEEAIQRAFVKSFMFIAYDKERGAPDVAHTR